VDVAEDGLCTYRITVAAAQACGGDGPHVPRTGPGSVRGALKALSQWVQSGGK